MKRISIDLPEPLENHFKVGSALREFIAGRLGAPGCWPVESFRARALDFASNEAASIQRWESDGGRIIAPHATPIRNAFEHLYPNRPLLTQLI